MTTLSLKSIFLTESKKPKVWYHGTNSDIQDFSIDYTGKGNDQEGPGIYFTSDKNEARQYGKNIEKVTLNPRKLVPNKGIVGKKTILELMRKSPVYEEVLTNWDESKSKAERFALDSIYDSYNGNPQEIFQAVWWEFYKNNTIDFLKEMTKLGFDGQIVKKQSGNYHFIVFNPNIIQKF